MINLKNTTNCTIIIISLLLYSSYAISSNNNILCLSPDSLFQENAYYDLSQDMFLPVLRDPKLLIVHANDGFDTEKSAREGILETMEYVGYGRNKINEATRGPSYLDHNESVDGNPTLFAKGSEHFIFTGGRFTGCLHQQFKFFLRDKMIEGKRFIAHFPSNAIYQWEDESTRLEENDDILNYFSSILDDVSNWSPMDVPLNIPEPTTATEYNLPFRNHFSSIPYVIYHNGKIIKSNSHHPFVVLCFWDTVDDMKTYTHKHLNKISLKENTLEETEPMKLSL